MPVAEFFESLADRLMCKRRTATAFDLIVKPHLEREKLSQAGAQRLLSVDAVRPGAREIVSRSVDNLLIQEALGRKYGPEVARESENTIALASKIHRAFQHHDDFLSDVTLSGVKRGGEKQKAYDYALAMIRVADLTGPKAVDDAALRTRLRAVADGSSPVSEAFADQRFGPMALGDEPATRAVAKWLDLTLTDRDLGFVRKAALNLDEVRTASENYVRQTAKAAGYTEEQLQDAVDRAIGPRETAYFPFVRLHGYLSMAENRDPLIRDSGDKLWRDELGTLARNWGLEDADSSLIDALEQLGRQAAQEGGTTRPFAFTNADSLGLSPKRYASPREAVLDLFDLASPAGALSATDQRALNANVSEILAAARRVVAEPASARGGLVGSLSILPEKVRNRFYERRVLTSRPWVADFHSTYAAAVRMGTKFNLVQPYLDEALPRYREIQRRDPILAKVMLDYTTRALGLSSRFSPAALDAGARLVRYGYLGTLMGNFSAALTNWIFQPMFTVAEFGPRAVAAATLAMGSGERGRYGALMRLLHDEGVGRDALFGGHGGVAEAMRALRSSPTGDEALRRLGNTAVKAADIFGATESFVQKQAFVTGMIDHLERVGALRPGLTSEQADAAIRAYVQTNAADLVRAGDIARSKSSFLFGDLGMPLVLRKIKDIPVVGAPTAMFTNYPTQAFARVAMWAHDASRLATHGPLDKAGQEGFRKLSTFFAYGTLVGGPFFLLPILRDMAHQGDDTRLGRLKDMFVAWEKHFSLAGLVGHVLETAGDGYETIDLASKGSISPTANEPLGIAGQITGGSPILRLIGDTAQSIGIGTRTGEDKERARINLLGGWLAERLHAVDEASPSTPAPQGGLATLIPAGITLARVVNAYATMQQGGRLDAAGRPTGPPSNWTREVLRFFGRPLGEVLVASEGKVGEAEATARSRSVERIKAAVLDGNITQVGEMLAADPTLVHSLDASDLKRAALARTLVPQARRALTMSFDELAPMLQRQAKLLGSGRLTPAEEYNARQIIAVGVMRLRSGRER